VPYKGHIRYFICVVLVWNITWQLNNNIITPTNNLLLVRTHHFPFWVLIRKINFNVHGSVHRNNILVYKPHAYFSNHMKTKTDQHANTHSNQFQLFYDSSRQQYGTYIIHYSIELIVLSEEYILFNNCNFNLVYRHSLPVNITLSITV
jgi:hypothetical protein